MVVKNQNIAPPYIYSNFALVRLVGLLTIIPSFSESSSEDVVSGTRALLNLFGRKNILTLGYSRCDSTERAYPIRSLSIAEEHEYTPHRNGGKNGMCGRSHDPFYYNSNPQRLFVKNTPLLRKELR